MSIVITLHMSLMPTKLETHHGRMDRAVPAGGDTVDSKLSQGENTRNCSLPHSKVCLKYKYTKCLRKNRPTNNGLALLVKGVTKLLPVIRALATQVTLFLPERKYCQGSK